jgi:hypothetical protein
MGWLRRPKDVKCEVHAYHWPPIQVVDWHHIWPLGMGGPDVVGNKVFVCPNGHRNIHEAILALKRGEKPIGTKKEIALAQRGHDESKGSKPTSQEPSP